MRATIYPRGGTWIAIWRLDFLVLFPYLKEKIRLAEVLNEWFGDFEKFLSFKQSSVLFMEKKVAQKTRSVIHAFSHSSTS